MCIDKNLFIVPDIHEERQESQHEAGGETITKTVSDHSSTPLHATLSTKPGSENYDDTEQPRTSRSVTDIYDKTEPYEIDEVLLLMGVYQPTNFRQAAQESD